MCNKTTPDAAAAALTTLMHALIDIECTAELAQGEEQKDTGHSSPWNVSDTSQRGR
ncbi:TPA: hypothetical protein ACWQ09_003404 [Escherichia coli]